MIKHIFRLTLFAAMLMAVTVIANANNVTYSNAPAGLVSETIGGELQFYQVKETSSLNLYSFSSLTEKSGPTGLGLVIEPTTSTLWPLRFQNQQVCCFSEPGCWVQLAQSVVGSKGINYRRVPCSQCGRAKTQNA